MRSSLEQVEGGHFVVGVDFGTTTCSVAYSHTVSPDQFKLVQSWPNRSGTADDVPTEVHYTNPTTREHLWGFSIPRNRRQTEPPLKWFKLLLQGGPSSHNSTCPNPASPPSADSMHRLRKSLGLIQLSTATLGDSSTSPAVKTAAQIRELGIEPADVIEDFLGSVRKIVRQNISDTYHREFVEKSKFRYIITIPAIWSDAAKASMVRAAQNAGYGQHRIDFHLVTEPEAAAAHTLKAIQPHDFKKNDTFIICDAGGGTVDLISYRIRSLNPLRVDEVVTGSGDLCGSVYLDHGFMAYMERRLGSAVLDKMSIVARTAMEKSWEELKFQFGTDQIGMEDRFEVQVPGIDDSDELDIFEGFHTISREDVQKIFDPVVNRVITLVKAQVAAVEKSGNTVSAILLVGGFGSSAYLFARLKAEGFSRNPESLQVIQPTNARTAIARGAVVRGLDGSIVADKRARRFYGITVCPTFIPLKAMPMRFWDNIDRCWRAPGYFAWSIEKGDILNGTHVKTVPFLQHAGTKQPLFEYDYVILATDQDVPPDFDWEADSEAYEVCKLSADLSMIPVSSWPVVTSDKGKEYYRMSVSIKVTILDDVLKFELMHNGKSYGEVKTEYK